jgi:hypothetical protein
MKVIKYKTFSSSEDFESWQKEEHIIINIIPVSTEFSSTSENNGRMLYGVMVLYKKKVSNDNNNS